MQGIVERKNSIPILSNVLAEARGSELRIAATDLDVSLRCGCAAEVTSEGAITLAAKKLYEIARSLPGQRRARSRSLPDAWASIECERVTLQDGGPAQGGLPGPARGARAKGGIEIPAAVLRGPHRAHGASPSPPRTRATTWPGRSWSWTRTEWRWWPRTATASPTRTARRRCRSTEPLRVLVPRKAIHELARLLEDGGRRRTFQQVENHLVFVVGGRTLASKMIEGQFPAFEKVIAA